MRKHPLGLFEGVGVELEYAIVDSGDLSVRPVADRLIAAEAGETVAEVALDSVAWSNELVLHVLELKTNGPARRLDGLGRLFHRHVERANEHLRRLGARLMPGGMHPFMDPERETRLWPHEYNDVYRAFDRIFGSRGHGWANLQSTHLNLPFADDREFARLHAAVRVILPIVPALAASSPFQEGRWGGHMDGRVAAYRVNARRVPSVTGHVVPEPATGRAQYERDVLGRIYSDLAPYDPEGVLRHEWVNARGAIARFGRGSIEVRLIDAQESSKADLAVAAAVHAAVRWLTLDPPQAPEAMDAVSTEELAAILDRTVRSGDRATVPGPGYLELFGVRRGADSAGGLWAHIIDASLARGSGTGEWSETLDTILEQGCLARRILESVGQDAPPARMRAEYERLCACLAEATVYTTAKR